MVETLTESFCERCGTRYEFSAPTRLNPLRKTRGFLGGLKNYLTSQDALSDAMSDAMRSEEDQLAAAQLEAFHQSFNFCIGCRQYTCINCWNDGEGRCRTCAPIPGTDDLAERLAASYHGSGAAAVPDVAVAEPILAEADAGHRLGLGDWPASDAPAADARDARDAGSSWPEADALASTAGSRVRAEGDGVDRTETALEDLTPEPLVTGAVPREEPVESHTPADADAAPEPVVADADGGDVEASEPELAPVEAEGLDVAWDAVPFGGRAAEDGSTSPPAPTDPFPMAAEADLEVAATEEDEPVAAEVTFEPLRVASWEQDAYELTQPESPLVSGETDEPVAAEADEPVAAEADELEPVSAYGPEPEPAPVATEADEPVSAEAHEPEPEPEPVAAEADEPEPAPVVADLHEPEPEPIAAEADKSEEAPTAVPPEPEAPLSGAGASEDAPRAPRIAPISETILRFPERPAASAAPAPQETAAEDDAPEVAARRAQLDSLGLGDPGEGPVEADRPAVLPYRSRGAAVTPKELAGRAASGGSFWEASAREVADAAANIGVQSCGQCGLSLSANARFCRRCGTRQARSA